MCYPWPWVGALTGYWQLEPAVPRSHIGRVDTPWSSTFRHYPLTISVLFGFIWVTYYYAFHMNHFHLNHLSIVKCVKDQSFYSFHLGIVRLLASDIQSCKISETVCLIELKFSGIVEGANRIAVLKFQSILTNLSMNAKTGNSTKQHHRCVLWSYRSTLHLEFFKNISFKWSNERPLGIAHMFLFILQWYSINISV